MMESGQSEPKPTAEQVYLARQAHLASQHKVYETKGKKENARRLMQLKAGKLTGIIEKSKKPTRKKSAISQKETV
jgi:hypothetical protein